MEPSHISTQCESQRQKCFPIFSLGPNKDETADHRTNLHTKQVSPPWEMASAITTQGPLHINSRHPPEEGHEIKRQLQIARATFPERRARRDEMTFSLLLILHATLIT